MSGSLALPPRTGWMPVLHQMVDSGDMARMHASAPKVYLVLKRHADTHTGLAVVSNRTLLSETGLSKPTLYKARASLQEFGYISFSENRHPPVYVIMEKIQYVDQGRQQIAGATFPFIPDVLHKLLDALRQQPLTQDVLTGGIISIGSVNIQINITPVEKGVIE